MRRLDCIFRQGDRELRIYESNDKLRGEVYNFKDSRKKWICAADFNYIDGDMDVYRVKEYFNFTMSYRVPFERKNNGRIVLFPVNKQKRIIWTNNNYEDWCDAMADEITEEEITPEYYADCCSTELDCERANLNIIVDGYIVCFASLGLWDGRYNGAKIIGTRVNDILHSNCDYITWYCDPYNVKCEATHHDGTNYLLYRVAESKEQAENLVNRIAYGGMTEEQFRRATKSLRPYVAKVYGW